MLKALRWRIFVTVESFSGCSLPRSRFLCRHVLTHSLAFNILRLSAPRLQSRKIYARSYKNFNPDIFLEDPLQNAPFHVLDVFYDVDDKLFAFETLYLDIINEQATIKKFHVRGNQVPFMTEQWRKSIRHRNKLWKIFT